MTSLNAEQPPPKGFPITLTLTAGIGMLILVSVLTVLGLGLWSARENTLSLLSNQASLAISSSVTRLRQHLAPATHQAKTIAGFITDGKINVEDQRQLNSILMGAMAAAPQIKGLVFINDGHQLIGIARRKGVPTPYTADYSRDQPVRAAIAELRTWRHARWAAPIWREAYGGTLLNLRQPVRRNGRFLGMIVALVSIGELSDYLAGLGDALGENAFILYDRSLVLAHRRLAGGYSGLSAETPLPQVAGFDDRVLAAIWTESSKRPLEIATPVGLDGFRLNVAGDDFIFIFRDLPGFGAKKWQVGTYFRSADVSEQLDRVRWAGIFGIAALVCAMLGAMVMARGMARPIIRLSQSASQVGQLDLANVEDLPASMFRELNQQSRAFNTMLQGLRWFEVYVPKTLVRRLIQTGEGRSMESEERELTVMFTDIAGFTTLAEGIGAGELAEFLNHHFALIAAEVEKEAGTVDKFIGDAVMAFWGAPEIQDDHAERACRAALAITRAIQDDNTNRRAEGEAEIGIRIGVHTGPAVVGNIGAPGRMNYTIVGDTVNVTQRLEQLSKEVQDGEQIGTLISGDTAAKLGAGFLTEHVGDFQVKGRHDSVSVYRLTGGAA